MGELSLHEATIVTLREEATLHTAVGRIRVVPGCGPSNSRANTEIG